MERVLTDHFYSDPWTRTVRSFKKGKAKWSRRLLHTKRDAIEDTHWNAQ